MHSEQNIKSVVIQYQLFETTLKDHLIVLKCW